MRLPSPPRAFVSALLLASLAPSMGCQQRDVPAPTSPDGAGKDSSASPGPAEPEADGGAFSEAAAEVAAEVPPPTPGRRPWIDTHSHPLGIDGKCDDACMTAALAAADEWGLKKAIVMSPPVPAGGAKEANEAHVRDTAKAHPERLFYGAGGNALNAQIQKTPEAGEVTDARKQELESVLEELVAQDDPVVLGELAVLHLSYNESHAYEHMPADTALFTLLVDLAAKHGVAIDVHLDVVDGPMDTPAFFTDASSLNPATLEDNLQGFEALLDHNLAARIVLAHVGRDTTGDMSAALMDDLLAAHPNLYLQVAPQPGPLLTDTAIVDKKHRIRPDWLALLQKYPDRAVLGTDTFYGADADYSKLYGAAQSFLTQIPDELAYRIGCLNPVAIYELPSGCE